MVEAPPFLGLPPGTQIPMQAVPTSVATKGHDGALYVSQLTGFPFPKGAANIYRIDPRSGRKTVYASGLTNVTDLAFDGRTLYAVQLANEGLLNGPVGSLVKVKAGGAAPSDHRKIADGLFAPYGIAIKGATPTSPPGAWPRTPARCSGSGSDDRGTATASRKTKPPAPPGVSPSSGVPSRLRREIREEPVVREGGIEPPRPCGHWHLKPARLPFRHSRVSDPVPGATAGKG